MWFSTTNVKNYTFEVCFLYSSHFLISFIFIKLFHIFCFLILTSSNFSLFILVLFCFVSRIEERGEETSKDLKNHSFTVFVTMSVQNRHIFLRLSWTRKAEGKEPQYKPWSIFPAAAYWREHCQDICRGVCRSGCSYRHIILTLRFSKNCKLNLREAAAELSG